jgi:hypothetical protein
MIAVGQAVGKGRGTHLFLQSTKYILQSLHRSKTDFVIRRKGDKYMAVVFDADDNVFAEGNGDTAIKALKSMMMAKKRKEILYD